MRRVIPVFLALLALAGCVAKKDTKADQARVEARLQQYSALLLKMDASALASMYAADGELVNPSQPAVKGRAAIEKFIGSFSDFKVLENSDMATSTLIDGDTAEQVGTYHQKVLSPQGHHFEVSGRLEIGWVRDPSGEWYIEQLATYPGK